MEKDSKITSADMVGLIIIVVIMLYFPYNMFAQHAVDVQATSTYTPM